MHHHQRLARAWRTRPSGGLASLAKPCSLALTTFFLVSCGGGGSDSTSPSPPPVIAPLSWIWTSGSSANNDLPTYGTEGTPATSNIPSARTNSASWTDADGNLWLFGGYGLDATGTAGLLNDLWEYSASESTWAWVGGSKTSGVSGVYGVRGQSSATTVPGARNLSVSWTDAAGNLWLFGGVGYANGVSAALNDLWEYSPSAGAWTWLGGSTVGNGQGVYGTQGVPAVGNVPGARSSAISWVDTSGNFWLFGGIGFDSQGSSDLLNDLWEYDPNAKTWVWVSGSNVRDASGVYGIKGAASSANVPGARSLAVAWRDSTGDLWLFGGNGIDSFGNIGDLNDLWQFNPTSGAWAWIGGFNALNDTVVYGAKGSASANNLPGARQEATSWTDSSGSFWMFGGVGNATGGSVGTLNDLWKYVPTTDTWEWVSGSNGITARSVYGTKGSTAVNIVPGARQDAIAWIDSSDDLWLFGGYGSDSQGNNGNHNDLWRFVTK